MKRVLVTGGTGCIGAATAWQLAERGAEEIVIASRSGAQDRLRLWFGEETGAAVRVVRGDVSDPETARSWIRGIQPTHVVHLGALQTPDCDAHPALGLEVNTGGTLHLLNAVAEEGERIERFVYASSAAVYGPRAFYPGPTVKETDPLAPKNLYGVWKVAGEHLVRLFHEKTQIPAVSLRLNTTYGVGRDLGKTSAPTSALKAVALGAARGRRVPFRMPYHGRENYHYAADVGAHFATATLAPFAGCGFFNIRGQTIGVGEFLARIGTVAAELGMGDAVDLAVADDASEAFFVYDLDSTAIEAAFPGLPFTPITTGIRLSLEAFRRMTADGRLTST